MKHLLSIVLLSNLLLADSEFNIEDDFLQSLNEVSEIATKSKLNIDDSPSFVTVLQSKKLQKLGIDTVYEALAQVPGVQLKKEATGVNVVVFRGVSQKGEVKLMIDGVTINNTYRGSIYDYLDFPIEMVERIEVIRGAGSVLYGSGAISGVVNVITKSANIENTNDIFASVGTFNAYKAGAFVSTHIGDVKIAVDAYYKTDDKMIDSTDRHTNDYSVGLKINDEHISLIARIKQVEIGNAYGLLGVPDLDKDKYNNKNGHFFTQLSYKNKLVTKTHYEISAGFTRYGQQIDSVHPSLGDLDTLFHENTYYTQADIKSKIFQNNEFIVGLKYEASKVADSEWVWKNPNPNLPQYNVLPSLERKTTSVYANNVYSFSSDLDLSTGLRFDYYSDFGDAISPTIGVIYKINSNFRAKALYTKAFRAPSWIEISSNANLNAETSTSYEAGFIYNNNTNSVVRLNIYKTRIDDLIIRSSSYMQSGYADFKGSEIEYIFTPNNQLEINLFASYVQAHDAEGADLADVANTLATASLIYEFDFGLSMGTLIKYVSSSKCTNNTLLDAMPSSTIIDGTLSYRFKDITTILVIKDILDKGTYYALPTSSQHNDFIDTGRSVLMKASWEF